MLPPDIVFWPMCSDLVRVWTNLLFTLLRVNNKLAADGAAVYHRLNFFLGVGSVIGGLAGVWIWIMPGVESLTIRMYLMIGHQIFHALVVVVQASCLWIALNGIEPLLMKAAEATLGNGAAPSGEIGNALQKIKNGKKFLMRDTLPPGLTLDIVFTAWPYLRNKVEYQVWISLLQAQGMIAAFIYMTRVDKPEPSAAAHHHLTPHPLPAPAVVVTVPPVSPRAAFQQNESNTTGTGNT